MLVGCKVDLREDQTATEELSKVGILPVKEEEGRWIAERIGACGYIECSAKTGHGVKQVFESATRASLNSQTMPISKKKVKKCSII